MKRCTHHIMIVTSKNRNASARLPVPDPDCLIITRTHYPWILLMELDGTNVVKMTKKSEQASSQLIVPNFDLVIIPYKREKERTIKV